MSTSSLRVCVFRFTYSIKEGNEEGRFFLDPVHGTLEILTTGAAQGYYLLNIVAQNSEYACHRGRVKVRVVLQEPIEFPNVMEVFVPENADIGDFVTQVQAIGDSGSIDYSIVEGNVGGAFQIDQGTGVILVASVLDFESLSMHMYTLTIEATNTSSGASASVDQIIHILDVNESPFFATVCATDNSCVFSVDENRAIGTLVDTVEADDPDLHFAPNGQLEFMIPDSVPFEISETGELRTTAILVHETRAEYEFDITVGDKGDPRLSITTTVTVQVTDLIPSVDVTPPQFPTSCDVSVIEVNITNIPLTRCIAVDFNDATNMTTVIENYEIVDGNVGDSFALDPDRGPGVIVNQRALDREEVDSYNLTIQATNSVGLIGTTIVVITVLDINDNAPEFVNLPTPSVLLTNSQIESSDNSVLTLQTTDADIGLNAQVLYSITEVIRLLDDNQTRLVVMATDMGSPSLSSTASVTVQFESPCVFQEYTVDPNSGLVTSQLFCSVLVEPTDAPVTIDGSRQLLCLVLRNIDASYRWLQDDSIITAAVPLPSDELAGDLIIFNAQLSDEGMYECEASSNLGNLLSSNAATVTIQVPPVIVFPPQDQAVELGRTVQFTCFGTGVPDPTYSWLRQFLGGGEVTLEPDSENHIVPNGLLLSISQVRDGDQGDYVCAAANPAGEDRATTTLIIFGLPNLVIVEVMNFSNPSTGSANSCQEFNSAEFETLMTDITGMQTIVTDTSGDPSLCNKTVCSPTPCLNGGTCSPLESIPAGYECSCGPGYTGQNCQSDINECDNDPCQSGGTCTNTEGSFSCECVAGRTGDLCQYTDVCETQSPCPAGLVCVTTVTVTEGYVCENQSGIVVGGLGGMSPGGLDMQVNSLEETAGPSDGNSRRRRQTDPSPDNGFVTQCEARFIERETSPGSYILVWACPDGVARPSEEEEERICQYLFERSLVMSCSTPSGVTLEQGEGTELPDITLSVSFILTETGGVDPLSATFALGILEETDALRKLRAQGYDATGFGRATPATEETEDDSDNTALIAGIVIGVTLALAVVLIVTVLVILRKKRSQKGIATGCDNRQVRMSAVQTAEVEGETVIENPYIELPNPPAGEPIFDESVYQRGYRPPEVHLAPQRTSTLERGAKATASVLSSLKRKTPSSANLLDDESLDGDSGDYDDVVLGPRQPPLPPKPVTTETHAENGDNGVIYGNVRHQHLGAMGHAGERWESYWKTQTLFRTDETTSPKK